MRDCLKGRRLVEWRLTRPGLAASTGPIATHDAVSFSFFLCSQSSPASALNIFVSPKQGEYVFARGWSSKSQVSFLVLQLNTEARSILLSRPGLFVPDNMPLMNRCSFGVTEADKFA